MRQSKISSPQLMLALFLSALPIILLQNYNISFNKSFLVNLATTVVGVVFAVVCFVPAVIVRLKTGTDFLTFAHTKTKAISIFITQFYSLVFVYALEFFLLKYSDAFVSTQNPEAKGFFIALVMLLAGLYASSKELSGVTRCSVFIFVFAVLTLAVVVLGNLSNLDFNINTLENNSFSGGYISSTSAIMNISFSALIFLSVSSHIKNFKVRQMVCTLLLTGAVVLLLIFLIWFVLGKYGTKQDYQIFMLSKLAHFGEFVGLDSMYLVLSAMSIFAVVSLCYIGIKKSFGKCRMKFLPLIYCIITFVLYLCAENINSVKEILISQDIFNLLIFTATVIVPSIYVVCFRRNLNV